MQTSTSPSAAGASCSVAAAAPSFSTASSPADAAAAGHREQFPSSAVSLHHLGTAVAAASPVAPAASQRPSTALASAFASAADTPPSPAAGAAASRLSSAAAPAASRLPDAAVPPSPPMQPAASHSVGQPSSRMKREDTCATDLRTSTVAAAIPCAPTLPCSNACAGFLPSLSAPGPAVSSSSSAAAVDPSTAAAVPAATSASVTAPASAAASSAAVASSAGDAARGRLSFSAATAAGGAAAAVTSRAAAFHPLARAAAAGAMSASAAAKEALLPTKGPAAATSAALAKEAAPGTAVSSPAAAEASGAASAGAPRPAPPPPPAPAARPAAAETAPTEAAGAASSAAGAAGGPGTATKRREAAIAAEAATSSEQCLSFKSELMWDWTAAVNRVDTGRQLLERLRAALLQQANAAVEQAGRTEAVVQSLVASPLETRSVTNAVTALRLEALHQAEHAREYAEALRRDVVEGTLTNTIHNHYVVLQQIKTDGMEAEKGLTHTTMEFQKAMDRYVRCSREAAAAAERSQAAARQVPATRTELALTCIRRCVEATAAEEDYREAVRRLNSCLSAYTAKMGIILQSLQDMEEKRILCFRDALRKLMVYQAAQLRNAQYDLDKAIRSVEEVNSAADVQEFLQQYQERAAAAAVQARTCPAAGANSTRGPATGGLWGAGGTNEWGASLGAAGAASGFAAASAAGAGSPAAAAALKTWLLQSVLQGGPAAGTARGRGRGRGKGAGGGPLRPLLWTELERGGALQGVEMKRGQEPPQQQQRGHLVTAALAAAVGSSRSSRGSAAAAAAATPAATASSSSSRSDAALLHVKQSNEQQRQQQHHGGVQLQQQGGGAGLQNVNSSSPLPDGDTGVAVCNPLTAALAPSTATVTSTGLGVAAAASTVARSLLQRSPFTRVMQSAASLVVGGGAAATPSPRSSSSSISDGEPASTALQEESVTTAAAAQPKQQSSTLPTALAALFSDAVPASQRPEPDSLLQLGACSSSRSAASTNTRNDAGAVAASTAEDSAMVKLEKEYEALLDLLWPAPPGPHGVSKQPRSATGSGLATKRRADLYVDPAECPYTAETTERLLQLLPQLQSDFSSSLKRCVFLRVLEKRRRSSMSGPHKQVYVQSMLALRLLGELCSTLLDYADEQLDVWTGRMLLLLSMQIAAHGAKSADPQMQTFDFQAYAAQLRSGDSSTGDSSSSGSRRSRKASLENAGSSSDSRGSLSSSSNRGEKGSSGCSSNCCVFQDSSSRSTKSGGGSCSSRQKSVSSSSSSKEKHSTDDTNAETPETRGSINLEAGMQDVDVVRWSLHRCLYHHRYWNRVAFWEEALTLTISEELQRHKLMEWWRAQGEETLQREDLRFREQNPCCSCLTSFGSFMVLYGIAPEQAQSLLLTVCRTCQLDEDFAARLVEGMHQLAATPPSPAAAAAAPGRSGCSAESSSQNGRRQRRSSSPLQQQQQQPE